ncbi:MAG TPA: ABC transporter ATP-binding protein [Solirubrobacteraceae bacterium]
MSGGHVKLQSLTKRFDQTVAVNDVSLEIQPGEFFSLLGPSGCGKTTTLRMVAGFEPPTNGNILLDGADVAKLPPHRRNVNTVFQSYALFPFLTVAENVAFGMKYKSRPKAELNTRVGEALELVQLTGYEKRRPNQLSGGQQQRVALARALVLRPSVLLLDEPLGALDAKLRRTLQVELGTLQKQVGISFLYVTHDQEEALTMSDRLAVMNHGRVVQLGAPEEVYNEPDDAYVADFLGVSNLMDAQVQPGGNGKGPCRLRMGDFTLEAAAGQIDATGAVKLAIRPERIHVEPYETSGANHVPGMVERLVFLGSITHVYVRLATGSTLQTLVRNDGAELPFTQGTAVSVVIPAEALRVLPDPGVSVAEIREETAGDALLDLTGASSGLAADAERAAPTPASRGSAEP